LADCDTSHDPILGTSLLLSSRSLAISIISLLILFSLVLLFSFFFFHIWLFLTCCFSLAVSLLLQSRRDMYRTLNVSIAQLILCLTLPTRYGQKESKSGRTQKYGWTRPARTARPGFGRRSLGS
jgi:hypothetical protein